jgi:hypothetical protein
MQARIASKGISSEKIFVIPPWSHDETVQFDSIGREKFRERHRLSGKFVIMYSGNHSPCHPLDGLLAAAERLRGDNALAFCFAGGGSEFTKVQRFAAERKLSNLTCLPYQPLDELSASLSAADLHVVVMGENFVGTNHPCKIYNAMRVAPAILYIGPGTSHVTDIFAGSSSPRFVSAPNGNADAVVEAIQRVRALCSTPATFSNLADSFSRQQLLPRLIRLLESPGKTASAGGTVG